MFHITFTSDENAHCWWWTSAQGCPAPRIVRPSSQHMLLCLSLVHPVLPTLANDKLLCSMLDNLCPAGSDECVYPQPTCLPAAGLPSNSKYMLEGLQPGSHDCKVVLRNDAEASDVLRAALEAHIMHGHLQVSLDASCKLRLACLLSVLQAFQFGYIISLSALSE